MSTTSRAKWQPSAAWNMFILFLSAYVVFALIFTYTTPENPELTIYLRYGDTVACVFFLIDVFRRALAAEDRVAFWKYGWIDVVSSIPNIAPLRWGRLYNFLRFIRALRALRGAMRISEYLFEDKLKNMFALIVSLLFACIAISGALVLHFERNAKDASITDAMDALWWAVNTITTVGSSGTYPVTIEGEIVGIFLMIVGIGLFTSTSGLVSAWLLGGTFVPHWRRVRRLKKPKRTLRKEKPAAPNKEKKLDK